MVNTDKIQDTVPIGLQIYTGVPIIRSNQDAEPPEMPYIVYTITTLESANNGTFGEHDDGIDRKEVTQTWSISAVAATNAESIQLANKARDWLDYVGTTYMNDRQVICQSVTDITNRDNVISVGYQYKNGFDAVFWDFSEVENPSDETGEISQVVINGQTVSPEDQDKVNVYQGIENAGKVLMVDANGYVVPCDMPSGGSGDFVEASDDGEGNVVIAMEGFVVKDDGEGNVEIHRTGFIVSDDGEGNVVLM